jgi:carbon storage regulator
MLVLSRKVGERILIGDQISVMIVRINGNSVRIGIDAPSAMAVIRDELKERMEAGDALGEAAVGEAPES